MMKEIFGEVFADGQFRGTEKHNKLPKEVITVGDYYLWSVEEPEKIGLTHIPTGETGVFNTADLEPYIKGFFGLNF
jgi:hypothetical protein